MQKIALYVRETLSSISAWIFAPLLFLSLLVGSGLCQAVNHVYSFTNQSSSQGPQPTLVQGRDGKMYGSTLGGACGSIFKISVSDLFAELNALQFATGCSPQGVMLGSDGNYYGTTGSGGSTNNGVLFRFTSAGTYTVLHEFAGGKDGSSPSGAPIQASDGNFYGVTIGDSTGSTVYRYTRAGNFGTIYQFAGTSTSVGAPLAQGADGNLYGTGSNDGANGCGSIFKMTTAGALLQSYSFPCGAGGNEPGPLMQASDGNFYGTTAIGGAFDKGTIFKATPDFQVSVLYSFVGSGKDGRVPFSGLFQATDGNLYGATKYGGSADMGTLFQISTTATYKSLYSFLGKKGKFPLTSLMQHTKGLLWGTASQGGANNLGTVFALDMGLGPFITFVQHTGKVGQTAQILGQGLKDTTGVTFNGVPATSFSGGADTYLRAVIPSGATTGPVVVTTAQGTLTSNVDFVVLP